MKEINILFLGGAKRVSLAEKFIEAGVNRNCKVSIFSYELELQVPIASVGTVIEGLKWNNLDIYDHLIDIIYKYNIHTVLPFVDAAIVITSRLAVMQKSIFIPISSEEMAIIMFDKATANEWFEKNNIPVPAQTTILPIIAKPRQGSASKGIAIIKDTDDLEYFKKKNNQDDFLIQKYIDGIEFTVDCYIANDGETISIVPRKRVEVTSGEATKTITSKDEEIIQLSKDIIKKATFRGPITIQFIRDNTTKETFVMEINPRFGGGVLASIEAGANSAQVLIDELLGMSVTVNTSWKGNVIMTRSFRETYFYAINN
jgi:carbamoyl-phosphate synthase large subunit